MNSLSNAPIDSTAREEVENIVDLVYPVGSIYLSVNNINPSTLFGGTWEAWGSGCVPVGVNTSDTDFNTVEKTGGAKTENYTPAGSNAAVTLTAAQSGVPAHNHGIPKLNVSSWTGTHKHTITMYGYQATSGGFPQGQSKASTNPVDYDTLIANASITVSGQKTDASNTNDNTAANATASHNHSFTGTSATINHLQPYITCYMWKRTA